MQGRFRQYSGSALWQTQAPGKFLHVIARSEATWQSVLLAVVRNKKQQFPANAKSTANLP